MLRNMPWSRLPNSYYAAALPDDIRVRLFAAGLRHFGTKIETQWGTGAKAMVMYPSEIAPPVIHGESLHRAENVAEGSENQNGQHEAPSSKTSTTTTGSEGSNSFGYVLEFFPTENIQLYIDRALYIVTYGARSNTEETAVRKKHVPPGFDSSLWRSSPQDRAIRTAVSSKSLPEILPAESPFRYRSMISLMSTRDLENGVNLFAGFGVTFQNNVSLSIYGDALRRWNSALFYKPSEKVQLALRIRGNAITHQGTLLEFGGKYQWNVTSHQTSWSGSDRTKRAESFANQENTNQKTKSSTPSIHALHGSYSGGQLALGCETDIQSFVSVCTHTHQWLRETEMHHRIAQYAEEGSSYLVYKEMGQYVPASVLQLGVTVPSVCLPLWVFPGPVDVGDVGTLPAGYMYLWVW